MYFPRSLHFFQTTLHRTSTCKCCSHPETTCLCSSVGRRQIRHRPADSVWWLHSHCLTTIICRDWENREPTFIPAAEVHDSSREPIIISLKYILRNLSENNVYLTIALLLLFFRLSHQYPLRPHSATCTVQRPLWLFSTYVIYHLQEPDTSGRVKIAEFPEKHKKKRKLIDQCHNAESQFQREVRWLCYQSWCDVRCSIWASSKQA